MRKAEGGGVNLWMDLLKSVRWQSFVEKRLICAYIHNSDSSYSFNFCIFPSIFFPLSNFPLLLHSLWKQAIIFYIFRNFPLYYYFFNFDILILLFFQDNFRPFILSFILTNHTLISVSVYHFFLWIFSHFFYLLFILVKSACFLFPRHPSLSLNFSLPFLYFLLSLTVSSDYNNYFLMT